MEVEEGVLLLVVVLLVGVLALLWNLRRSSSSPPGDADARFRASLLRALSVVAVGVLIVAFVGSGIDAFYPSPEPPEDPKTKAIQSSLTPEKQKEQREQKAAYEEQKVAYKEEISGYNRVASLIAVGAAVLILAAVPLSRGVGIPQAMRDGMALGGVLTLLYGLILALQAESEVLRFLMVAVALLVALVAVFYLRFRPERQGA